MKQAKPTSAEIRNMFVDYFKKNGHAHINSSSLIPENDPTLLFANAGMNQFKNVFLGTDKRDYKRAVSVQKCVRAGGKHNDLENVGFTARHHTFFEMLGNFSFGDYFKKDAIHFAWELLTKEMGIPKEKLYVTVFETDDEAADIWHKQEGVARDRIFRLGEKDNFWRMGDTGPCGPCTEIFYDHGASAGKESDPFKGILAGEDRFVEIWNLVFMQFFEKAPGQMEPLPKPSVDTGSGLERVVAALQGHTNNYDTDLFSPLIDRAVNLTGVKYKQDPQLAAAYRVLADHSRSTGFLIADGALPSNEGRGYVLRRIMRRAIRYGRKISTQHSLMPVMIEGLIDSMSGFYPELQSRRSQILTTVKEEEARFLSTLDQGTAILDEELRKLKSKNSKQVPGDLVFKLYDTYGFPVDLTRVMANEQGFSVDEKNFELQMDTAREKAKSSWKGKAALGDEGHRIEFSQGLSKSGATRFTGYDAMEDESKITGLSNGTQSVDTLKAGQSGFIVTSHTPFYAEGGGQVGDQGLIKSGSSQATVLTTTKLNDIYLHHVEVTVGAFKLGENVKLIVQNEERRNTMANHSATHLLHAALRQILGTHVTQAGSAVDSQRLRFDFTHNKPLSSEELQKIEDLVNQQISSSIPVQPQVMGYKEALKTGALALFGEKYGDQVRVLKMGEFSTEFCGGTHVSNTSQIRVFKIMTESGVSAGVRRLEAQTGDNAIQYLLKNSQEISKARQSAGLQEGRTLLDWIESKKEELKNLEKELKKQQGSQINIDELSSNAKSFQSKKGSVGKLVTADLSIEDRDVLAQVTDQLKNKIQSGVVIVVGKGQGTHPVVVSVSKNLNPDINAGAILKELAAILGGKGGGRPDFAQGAVPDRTNIVQAFKKAEEMLN